MQEASSLRPARGLSPVTGLVYRALVKMLGKDRAEVLDFYVDSRLAAEDPDGYERALLRLLGEHGGRLVVSALRSDLGKAARTGSFFEGSFLNDVRMTEKALAFQGVSAGKPSAPQP